MPDTTAAIRPGTRLAIIVESLAGLGTLTPHELVRCDPLRFDVVARELGAQGIVLRGDTTLRFDGAPANV